MPPLVNEVSDDVSTTVYKDANSANTTRPIRIETREHHPEKDSEVPLLRNLIKGQTTQRIYSKVPFIKGYTPSRVPSYP